MVQKNMLVMYISCTVGMRMSLGVIMKFDVCGCVCVRAFFYPCAILYGREKSLRENKILHRLKRDKN